MKLLVNPIPQGLICQRTAWGMPNNFLSDDVFLFLRKKEKKEKEYTATQFYQTANPYCLLILSSIYQFLYGISGLNKLLHWTTHFQMAIMHTLKMYLENCRKN